MKGITFERERKGYSVDQVEAYINVLQENYNKVTSSSQEAEEKVAELERKLAEQKDNLDAANRQFEEEKKVLKRRFNEQEALLKSANNSNTEEQHKLEMQQLEKQKQEQKQQYERQQQELKQQLEKQQQELNKLGNRNTDSSKLIQQVNEKEQEIKRLQSQMAAVEEEMSSQQEQLKKLTEENQQLKSEKESGENIKNTSFAEHLAELYTKAQKQADAYVEQVKQDMAAERAEITAERETIIAQAKAEARKIDEEARQKQYNEFVEDRERLKKEQEVRMAEIAYLKKEAEAERINAKEESESIIRQAQLKFNLAEEKDKIRTEKALAKTRQVETRMEEQYQQMHSTLTDTANRMLGLLECIANINDAKSIEEIRKYREVTEKNMS
ncbi:MAG: hypothetical protein ACRC3H_01455 [Lachnospiraceae bacterium]